MSDLLATLGLAIGCGILLGLLHEAFHARRRPLERRGFAVRPVDHDRAARRLARLVRRGPGDGDA